MKRNYDLKKFQESIEFKLFLCLINHVDTHLQYFLCTNRPGSTETLLDKTTGNTITIQNESGLVKKLSETDGRDSWSLEYDYSKNSLGEITKVYLTRPEKYDNSIDVILMTETGMDIVYSGGDIYKVIVFPGEGGRFTIEFPGLCQIFSKLELEEEVVVYKSIVFSETYGTTSLKKEDVCMPHNGALYKIKELPDHYEAYESASYESNVPVVKVFQKVNNGDKNQK